MPLVSMTVNGKIVSADVEGRTLLVQLLREHLHLTGTHVGCDTSQCGCCTVHVDGKGIKSCSVLALSCSGANVVTIEGLAAGDKLHPMQEAFREHHGLQCGYCTPGMILSAYALLLKTPRPTREQIVQVMDDNLCRCGSYGRINTAVHDAAKTLQGRS